MKKILILLGLMLFMSCTHTISEDGVVTEVSKNYGGSTKYIITVSLMDSYADSGMIKIETNTLYQVGDKIKITKE